jgi:hypothetical protein
MKKVTQITFIFFSILTSCVRKDEEFKNIGEFNEQLTGFEGTIIRYASNNRPVEGYPLRFQAGNYGVSTFISQSGVISTTTSPDAAAVYDTTNQKGQFRVVLRNKELPLFRGYLVMLGSNNSVFRYTQPEFLFESKPNELPISGCEYSKIKKVDIRLYEVVLLILDSRDINVPFDKVEVRGLVKSVITGKVDDFLMVCDTPPLGGFIINELSFKANESIDLTISIYKDNKLSSTRTMKMPMTEKENYIKIF